VFGSEDRLN
jgi:hypothetical protein